MLNKRFVLSLIIFALIISLVACGKASSETLSLPFSKGVMNSSLLYNYELDKFTSTYLEYYDSVEKLYNQTVIDNNKYQLKHYPEYDYIEGLTELLTQIGNSINLNDNKKIVSQMKINVASTNYLLAAYDSSLCFNDGSMQEKKQRIKDNLIENYEYIQNGE